MVKAIIFDLQGTLVENGVYPSPLRQIKNILRIDAPFSDFVMRFEKVLMVQSHPTLKEAFTAVCDEFNVQPREYLIEKMVGLWNKNKLLSKLYPDTLSTLDRLKGDYKLVLVANIDSQSKDMLTRFGIDNRFDLTVLSCDSGLLKNERGFYDTITEGLGITPQEMIMVGDSIESDIDPAKAIGVKGILVDRHNKREYSPKIIALSDLDQYLDRIDVD